MRIVLPSGIVGYKEAARDAFTQLAGTGRTFQRHGVVVELRSTNADSWALDIVTPDGLRSKIEGVADLYAWRIGAHGENLLKPGARMSQDVAKVFLASDEVSLLPPITGIHNSPILICEATQVPALLTKGYHQHGGGRLVTGGQCPVMTSVAEARAALLLLIEEFDFTTPMDRSRAIAAILTPAMRFGGLLVSHIPVFVAEANDSQAGKGALLETSQLIYNEIPSFVTQKSSGGVGGLDEALSQALVNGRPFVQLDNFRGNLGSTFFEALLTCPLHGTVPARVPHKAEIQVDPSRFIFHLSSNGFTTTRDLANRACIVRIKKRPGFAFRQFPEGDLLAHIKANQPRYLGAVLSIVNEWLIAGRPRTADLRGQGRFRDWAQVLDWIIQHLMLLPPLMEGHEAAQERASNPALAWLREVCLALERETRLGVEITASEIADISAEHELDIPGLLPNAVEEKIRTRIGCIMAKAFGAADSMDAEDFTLTRTVTIAENGKTQKKYVVHRSSQ